MKFSELASYLAEYLLPGQPVPEIELNGASADSRQIEPGMLFCAVHGAVSNGNDFICKAVDRGAAAVLSDSGIPLADLAVPVLYLKPDAGYFAIARVAAILAGCPADKMTLLGITGTSGKTTTAFLLRDILRRDGKKVGMIGTVVYDVGDGQEIEADRTTPTPFELQGLMSRMVKNGVTHLVMECSSAAMVQRRFDNAKFQVAAFTNFSRDHLDFHGTMENYFAAKKMLFTRSMVPGGTAVINADDEHGAQLAGELLRGCPALNVKSFSLNGNGSACVTRLAGRYNQYNAKCAAIMAEAIGIPGKTIAEALADSKGAPGRLQRVDCANGVVAFVDYAHTPEEIAAALQALRPLCSSASGTLAILFGCGGDRDRGKRPQMGQAASRYADVVFLTSDNPRTEKPGDIIGDILPAVQPEKLGWVEEDRALAIPRAVRSLKNGDVLLIAGKGHEACQEINGVKIPFRDVDCLAKC